MGLLGGAISAAGSIVGGMLGSKGAKEASEAYAEAAQISADAARELFEQLRDDLAQYREIGGRAFDALFGTPAVREVTPGQLAGLPGRRSELQEELDKLRSEGVIDPSGKPIGKWVEKEIKVPRYSRAGRIIDYKIKKVRVWEAQVPRRPAKPQDIKRLEDQIAEIDQQVQRGEGEIVTPATPGLMDQYPELREYPDMPEYPTFRPPPTAGAYPMMPPKPRIMFGGETPPTPGTPGLPAELGLAPGADIGGAGDIGMTYPQPGRDTELPSQGDPYGAGAGPMGLLLGDEPLPPRAPGEGPPGTDPVGPGRVGGPGELPGPAPGTPGDPGQGPLIDLRPGAYEQSKAYDWQIEEAQRSIERMAAARGYRLSPRAAEEFMRRSQGLAQEDYYRWFGSQLSKADTALRDWQAGRAAAIQDWQYPYQQQLGEWMTERATGLEDWQQQRGALAQDWATQMGAETGDWLNKYNAWLNLLRGGQQAAGQTGAGGTALANQLTNIYQGVGQMNADAAMNSANAWAQALQGGLSNLLMGYGMQQPQIPSGGESGQAGGGVSPQNPMGNLWQWAG